MNQDDFDHFLKENADDLRMRPSAAVWGHISKELNRKKRRLAGFFVLALTLISGGLFTWYNLSSNDDLTVADNLPPVQKNSGSYTAANAATPQNTFRTQTTSKQPEITATAKPRKSSATRNTAFSSLTSLPLTEAPFSGHSTDSVAEAPNSDNDDLIAIQRQNLTPLATERAQKNEPDPELHVQQTGTDKKTAPLITPADAAASVTPAPRKNRRLSWTLFITPTVSYRKLSENKSFERTFLTPGTPPMVSALYNINNAVIHKPDLGLEFGTMARYALSRRFKLRTGFQFNISRYDIKAFSYVPEVATIALSNGFGVDSVQAITNYRNFTGGRTNWLQNFYFQASLPVGVEVNVAGNDKFKWNVASSIQPTYVIGNRAYLITADYKNYARVPWLTRRWNMNTSFETFVSYRSGKTEWQVGPQVRYQVLSSFVKKYPVKENLFDFGMKVGVTIR